MKIEVVSIMRNEAVILPYWLRHYGLIADAITVFDAMSADGTDQLLRKGGVTVLQSLKKHLLDDGYMAEVFSQFVEESLADWVICVDADEFVYPVEFAQAIEFAPRSCSALAPIGYEMKYPIFPQTDKQIWEVVRTGKQVPWLTKPCVVRGGTKIKFGCGRHYVAVKPEGFRVFSGLPALKLLHYRDLGYHYYSWHHARNALRLDPHREEPTWGQHNYQPLTRERFNEHLLDSEIVI